jgi:hypothetical protein
MTHLATVWPHETATDKMTRRAFENEMKDGIEI